MDRLSELALKWGTDKGPHHHNYTPIYGRYLHCLRHEDIDFLEIGVGGYHYPERGGQSLRMWRDYFTRARITGIDVHPKSFTVPDVQILQGSQVDGAFLQTLPGPWDVIIDDGSHQCAHVIASFNLLWPLVKPGGIYIVEDTETSYWPEEYGGSTDPQAVTTMNYFKAVCDSVNVPMRQLDSLTMPVICSDAENVDKFYSDVESIHFYKGLILVFKALSVETKNVSVCH